ncbi:mechanosensitive ion channel [Halomicrobium sp. IBSBa]|uniref:mechanosensitive ion channel domain-containing protein n=1 Tax=unclassified Halomicrobium TaxID=2610901 RepID=UPI001ABFE1CB|nr:mechanosensitive ion channel domain-containing protein [Halomicrobium sp. IBSBa]MBO4248252.1 mechanosensitive ion channel [Halomicrobium sp. IBSBa]
MQLDWPAIVRSLFSREAVTAVAISILVLGVLLAYLAWRYMHYFLSDAGIDEAVEGTAFERTAQRFGTSTVGLIATLVGISLYIAAMMLAGAVSQRFRDVSLWSPFVAYLPNLFVALFALMIGLIAGDKAKLSVSEKFRSIKLPEAELLPELVKYSIIFLAGLVALGQLGVATEALLIVLAAYAFGLVFLGGLAFKQLLSAGAAGVYLVLSQPYSIGDEVRIQGQRGIVQEVDIFVTHIESEGEEYVVPNDQVFAGGIVRIRD